MRGELFDLALVGSESGERWFFGFGSFSRYIHDHIAAFSQQLFDPDVEVLYTIPCFIVSPTVQELANSWSAGVASCVVLPK